MGISCDIGNCFVSGAKGTGYLFAAVATATALLVIAATVTAIALGLLTWDGLFVYSIAVQAPVNLIWAIPVTLAFLVVDLLVISAIGRLSHQMSNCLIGKTSHYLHQSRHQFQHI